MTARIKSGVAIARMLDCEGFDEHTASAVHKWSRNRARKRANRDRHAAKIRERFHSLVQRLALSDGDRQVLGQFISIAESISFEAGVMIGLQSHAMLDGSEFERETVEKIGH